MGTDVNALFDRSPARSTRIALEHELLTADAATGAAVAPSRIRAAVAGAVYEPWVSLEPGGQVELSLPCSPDAGAAAAHLAAVTRALAADLAVTGVVLHARSVDTRPLSSLPLALTSSRYSAMQARFDAFGPAGRRMMRATASTQVCLDWWPGRAGLEQWRVLQLAAPFVAAAFARATGPTSRLATWLEVDPTRTAFDDRLLHGDDPVAAYEAFAAGAVPFVEPDQHLSTLFPPVRPRGRYLEVRFADVQPLDRVEPLAATLAGLMYDDELRRRTLAALSPLAPRLADLWHDAAHGTLDLGVGGIVRSLVALVGVPARATRERTIPAGDTVSAA